MSKDLTPKMGQFDEIISTIDNARTVIPMTVSFKSV